MDADVTELVRQADSAAAQGNVAQARSLLERVLRDRTGESPAEDIDLWLKLAAVCRAAGDRTAALDACDRALTVEPLHFTALLLRASLLDSLGRSDAGDAYGKALGQLPDEPLPPHMARTIERARTCHAQYQQAEASRLEAILARAAPDATPEERRRLDRLCTNTVRLTRPWHSEPTHFHLPGLAEHEYHERAGFDWLERLEAATDLIADELHRVMNAEFASLVPYVQYHASEPMRQWKALNHSRDWTAIHLLRNGERVEANARHCPATMALLDSLPQPRIRGVSPNAMFSLLAPKTRIPPHTGVANTRLLCHLPLIVPDGCWFRVGSQRRLWKRGEAWVFDDTIEHEAANESDELRVILIADIWHPGLSAAERQGVAALVAAHVGAGHHGL